MEDLKERITYVRKCSLCGNTSTFILRDKNVNPMNDEDAYKVVLKYQADAKPEFKWCEEDSMVTRQEIIAFDY